MTLELFGNFLELSRSPLSAPEASKPRRCGLRSSLRAHPPPQISRLVWTAAPRTYFLVSERPLNRINIEIGGRGANAQGASQVKSRSRYLAHDLKRFGHAGGNMIRIFSAALTAAKRAATPRHKIAHAPAPTYIANPTTTANKTTTNAHWVSQTRLQQSMRNAERNLSQYHQQMSTD